ncbi:probable 1-acyl-sn-glycerol-3-phosphate acyltransferase 4 isoform X2 [Vigna angularis]|uniref:probable 1-acyl-sn-glycerol-3-phosphate acyltransferase 4 isoform X2 n=1 Tax=Phaseolus angularis TaxID=3914 RepID=UPI0022B549B5|nr:probable 1-acyl-sn-glycerol-3-phosphate acyltransferase 4 isoform X2 [Vigna angularis]
MFSVERKWEVDEQILHQKLSTLQDPQDPLWLALFPEGTDYTDQKSKNSQKFAAETGLPVLKNVLLPKTKGFHACLEALRGSLDAVYDVTIAYKNQCPSFLDNVFGVDPSEVHLHVRCIPVEEIPASESKASSWLIEKFKMKDQLLSDFKIHGHFPDEQNENEISTFKSLFSFTVIVSFTAMFIYFTLFSVVWFKVYVGLSCAYLALATRFNFQLMPLSNYVHALHNTKKQNTE